jgi:ADP-ribosylglycohydrolase
MDEHHWPDRVAGCLIGQAVGDALGLGAEFMSRRQVASRYGREGLRRYDQITYGRGSKWQPGDWSDDTDQLLCILDSLLERNGVDSADMARRIHEWAVGGGAGIGHSVSQAVTFPGYLKDPTGTAKFIWSCSGERLAANGGVMRTSVLGLWSLWSDAAVVSDSAGVCRITHADPRCIASCVATSVCIANLARGMPVDLAVDRALERAERVDARVASEVFEASSGELGALRLDQNLDKGSSHGIGYTYLTTAAGFWALRNAETPEKGIIAVVNEGGDADTNAAVAGALLGAREGLASIPEHWIDGLRQLDAYKRRVEDLVVSIRSRWPTDAKPNP